MPEPQGVHWKVYVDGEIANVKESAKDQRETDSKATEAALAAADKLVAAALASSEKAVSKQEDENKKWREQANEWRAAMSDRERDFLSRREFYSIVSAALLAIGVIVAILSR